MKKAFNAISVLIMRTENAKKIAVSVIVPALNEERHVSSTISNTLKAFEDFGLDGEIIVVDDGSTDRTGEVVGEFIKKHNDPLRMLRHESPRGIGASFWDGVDTANGYAIVMIPGDNETDPWEILRYFDLLKHVDIVIPFAFNREVRTVFRRAMSLIYRSIVNYTFAVNFNYTNGTIIYRKSMLDELTYRSQGFFFQTDILIRTVKKGYLFAEVPYRLGIRREGISKAITFPSLINVIRGYLRLVRDYYFKKRSKSRPLFSDDSLTAIRKRSRSDLQE